MEIDGNRWKDYIMMRHNVRRNVRNNVRRNVRNNVRRNVRNSRLVKP